MRRIATLLFTLTIFSISSFAQILEPVKWTWKAKHLSGNEFELIYTANIDDGWSVYSQYLESEDGPVKTSFEYDSGDHFALKGKTLTQEIKKKLLMKFFK